MDLGHHVQKSKKGRTCVLSCARHTREPMYTLIAVALQRVSADAEIRADLMNFPEGVPQGVGREGKGVPRKRPRMWYRQCGTRYTLAMLALCHASPSGLAKMVITVAERRLG